MNTLRDASLADSSCHCQHLGPLPRRRLLQTVAAGLGLLLLPVRALAKKVAVRLDGLPALQKVGGYVIATIKGRDILLVREGEQSVRAAHAHCTHKQFRLRYDPASRQIHCSNHGSRFDLSGRVVKGPASRPLPIYSTRLDAGNGRIILELD